MNETTHDPEGVDDPALLAEIEAEFAELTREIERISAMPRSMAPQKNKLVEALRASWRSRLDGLGGQERPEWRQRLDATLGHAVDRLLEDGIQENADGSLGFALRGDTLQAEGGPVIRGLLDGFAHMLEERFPAPDKAPPPAPDAPPPNALQALFGNLGHAFAGVLKTAIQNVATNVPTAPQGAESTTASGPDANGTSVTSTTEVGLGGEQKLSTTFEFDSRVNASAPPAPGDAPTSPAPKTAAQTAAGAATNAFFQQLMQGFGQAIRTAVTPLAGPVTPPAASPANAAATDAAATDAAANPAPPDAAATAVGAPAPNPLGGLGQLLSQALQRAIGPGGAPVVLQAVQPTAPVAAAATPVDAGTPAPDAPPAGATAAAAPPPTASEEAKAPTLNIDFAGLLGQLLNAGKKPPST